MKRVVRLVKLMTAPYSTDKWERRRHRASVFTIVSILLAVLVSTAWSWRSTVGSSGDVAEPRGRAHGIHDAEEEVRGQSNENVEDDVPLRPRHTLALGAPDW